MNVRILGLALLALAVSAQASLVFTDEVTVFGTGLGAVNTIATVHDPGGPGDNDGTEGGCVERVGTADVLQCDQGNAAPGPTNITELDNTAINQTVLLSAIDFQSGDNIAAVVNISETGQDVTVTLTDLYLAFYGEDNALLYVAEFEGADFDMTQGTGTGLGGSGFVFILDPAQQAIVTGLDVFRIGGGVQFANGSTNDGNDTLHVISVEGEQGEDPIPEPTTYLTLGAGLMALAMFRRSKK